MTNLHIWHMLVMLQIMYSQLFLHLRCAWKYSVLESRDIYKTDSTFSIVLLSSWVWLSWFKKQRNLAFLCLEHLDFWECLRLLNLGPHSEFFLQQFCSRFQQSQTWDSWRYFICLFSHFLQNSFSKENFMMKTETFQDTVSTLQLIVSEQFSLSLLERIGTKSWCK